MHYIWLLILLQFIPASMAPVDTSAQIPYSQHFIDSQNDHRPYKYECITWFYVKIGSWARSVDGKSYYTSPHWECVRWKITH